VCRTRGCVLFTRIVTRHLLMVTRGCARFPCASSHVTRALFARVALAVAELFVHIVHALFSCCRASFARVAHAVRTRRHMLFACVACATYSCRCLAAHRSHVSRVSMTRVTRRLLMIISCFHLRTLTLIMLICRVIYFRYLT
jgi:hypothetical protein